VLVSQVVTQRGAHLQHVREVAEAIDATYPAPRRRWSSPAGHASTRVPPPSSVSTASSARALPRARSPVTSSTQWAIVRPSGRRDDQGGRRGRPYVTHRRYVSYAEAHYGGNLVDGAYVLALFGDVANRVVHAH